MKKENSNFEACGREEDNKSIKALQYRCGIKVVDQAVSHEEDSHLQLDVRAPKRSIDFCNEVTQYPYNKH